MQKLSYLVILIFWTSLVLAQSPHGNEFKIDCAACHNAASWKVNKTEMTFDHNTTTFGLTGQHKNVDCKSCHQNLKFKETRNECSTCHTDMHNQTLGADCAKCHTTKSWIVQNTKAMHQSSRFPLEGKHAVADCASCHKSATNLQFQPQGIACIDCHRSDYMAAKSPDHQQSGYSTNCVECHGDKSTGWTATNFEHSFFPLTEGHRISCTECHTSGSYQKISNVCSSCHQSDYNAASNPNHKSAGFSTTCTECHTTSPNWNPATFTQHDALFFPIYSGEHKGEWNKCTECHTTSTYSNFSCTSCHEHNQADTDSEHKGISGYSYNSLSCYGCHPMGNKSGTFNHNSTSFPLTGAHTTVQCASCHTSGYGGTSSECKTCHQKNYTAAQTPNHTAAGISVDCKTCHTSTAWQPSSFKHSTTGFDLTGAHSAVVQCSSCHIGNTTSAKSECISCHQVQYNNAKGHVASKFPTDCTMCHNSTNWLQTTFNHSTTSFPLTGAHTTVSCVTCHTSGYAGTSTECNACHQKNYTAAQTPSHTAAGLPVDCKICHTSTAWQPSSFKHSTTGFALTGAHSAIVQCSSCHIGNTTSAKSECISCHQVQYNNAKGHVASKFPTDCTMCHNSTNWLQTTFNHSTTSFPLTGAHTTVSCATCHSAGYTGTATECNACHQKNYTAAQTPSHTAAGLPVDCKTCHTTTSWQPSSFKHSTTGFELAGAHAAIIQCSACHIGTTVSAKSECISCHQVQYNNAPGHLASSFPTDCKMCHSSNNWLGAIFNHSTTSFPLTGAHTTVSCASCHSSGYSGTSMECRSCHTTDYNSTTNPNHKTLALAMTCADCHTTNAGWQPASFAVHNNYYALTGAHSAIAKDCAACHKGNYTTTANTCYGCHSTDYKNTTNPAHSTAQFPTECTSCHTTNTWAPSTFNHDSQHFPIYSGKHKGKWTKCSECHTSPTNFALFSCIICHEHSSKTSVDSDHRGVSGYTYTGTSCYACHPKGSD